jgi:hypothetical protein
MRGNSTQTNGSATILGRGVNHRKPNQHQRAHWAADAVTGARPFVPSCEQACVMFGVPRYVLTRHLKARRQFAEQHSELAGNGKAGDSNGLLTALQESSPAERVTAARAFGIDTIWDT